MYTTKEDAIFCKMDGFFSSMTNLPTQVQPHRILHQPPRVQQQQQQQQQHNGHGHGPSNNPRVQQSEKQFKCDFCDKTFTQRRNQRAHIRTVHEKLKPFQCTHCGLTANRKFNLLSHIKKMHGSTEGSTSVIDTRLSGSGKIQNRIFKLKTKLEIVMGLLRPFVGLSDLEDTESAKFQPLSIEIVDYYCQGRFLSLGRLIFMHSFSFKG